MENNPKSQVVERLREAQNVLVTVSNNPSVDQLSSAIGLTLMMNKLGKHATAVFSGTIPSTLEFLKPQDTLEQNTDSLRDFIISLDKAKADKLRYKVEEDVVKIFITPYKTSLSQADLDFSQGDFNVDVVIALGVDQREHIDQAIISHGRILHDATVIGVMAGQAPIDVGSINWQEPAASSLCEMLVSISEAFQSGLLDGQMATAYLTGIVAETERFSNDKTTPKVMTMSAQLMAAGANQQLIATKLAIPTVVDDGVPADLPQPAAEVVSNDGTEGVLSLHEEHVAAEQPVVDELEPEMTEEEKAQIHIDEHGKLQTSEELAKAVSDVQAAAKSEESAPKKQVYSSYMTEPPQMGGTLTASSQDDEMSEPSSDPLSNIPASPDPLGGIPVASYPESYEPATSTPSPLLSVQDDAESVKASEVPVTESPVLASDGETNPEFHLGPEVNDKETLTEIESAVQEYTGEPVHHDEQQVTPSDNTEDPEEAARKAVLNAMAAGGYDANRPTPLESLGAQPLSSPDELHDNDNQAPPAVPPPFPMPQEDDEVLPPPPPYAN